MATGLKSVMILSLAVLSSAAVGGTDFEALVKQADDYYDAFDNRDAMQLYEKAWHEDPTNVHVLTRLTWTCNNIGEELDSRESEPYFAQAIGYAEKLKELAPDQALTWFLSAITSGNLGLYRGGREKVTLSRHVAEDAERAIALDPSFSPGYVVLGVYYREVAQLNWALRMVARHLLGGLPEGTLEGAEKMLLKGIEKEPGNVYAHYQLALTYEAMKQPDKAIRYYRNVISLPVVDHQDPVFRERASARIRELQ